MEDRNPLSNRLQRMGESFESSISQTRAEQLAAQAVARAGTGRAGRRSLVAALAGVTFALVAAIGLGAIADRAVPGQWLYGVDRAYEQVGEVLGVTPDPVEERLHESRQLVARGDLKGAIDVVDEVLGRYTPPTTVPAPAVASTTSTTVVEPPSVPDAPVVPAESPASAPAEVPTIDAADPVARLILAIESFERAVRAARDDPNATDQLELAVAELEAAKKAVDTSASAQGTTTTVPGTTTTVPGTTTTEASVDSTTSSTSTTVVESTTSTTVESTTTSSTTSSTLPDEGGNDGTGDGNGSGGGGDVPPPTIIIPIEH